jgi:hypothetical protein
VSDNLETTVYTPTSWPYNFSLHRVGCIYMSPSCASYLAIQRFFPALNESCFSLGTPLDFEAF